MTSIRLQGGQTSSWAVSPSYLSGMDTRSSTSTTRAVAVFSGEGLLIETDMDDIELSIARRTLAEAMSYEEA